MAFESQLAAQREVSKQRIIIKQKVFMLRIAERTRANKSETILDVRVPMEVLKKAKMQDKHVDIFFDHENRKCMLAPSLAGLKLTLKGNEFGSQQFLFTKGFTPDFGNGGTLVNEYEIVPHGDEQGVVFEYPPLAMVTGRNALKDSDTPTRAQTFGLALLAKERQRTAEASQEISARAQDIAAAPPASTKKFEKRKPEAVTGLRVRRHFDDAEKKEAVRAHLKWMEQGFTFTGACEQLGIGDTAMYRWRGEFLKTVEREERKAAQGPQRDKRLNGSASHARVH